MVRGIELPGQDRAWPPCTVQTVTVTKDKSIIYRFQKVKFPLVAMRGGDAELPHQT